MATGKALVCHPKGDQNSLVLEDVPIPKPEAKQVLVKVQAVAQNPTGMFPNGLNKIQDGR